MKAVQIEMQDKGEIDDDIPVGSKVNIVAKSWFGETSDIGKVATVTGRINKKGGNYSVKGVEWLTYPRSSLEVVVEESPIEVGDKVKIIGPTIYDYAEDSWDKHYNESVKGRIGVVEKMEWVDGCYQFSVMYSKDDGGGFDHYPKESLQVMTDECADIEALTRERDEALEEIDRLRAEVREYRDCVSAVTAILSR